VILLLGVANGALAFTIGFATQDKGLVIDMVTFPLFILGVILLLGYLISFRRLFPYSLFTKFIVIVLCAYPFLFYMLDGYQGDIVHYERWYNNIKDFQSLMVSTYLWKGDFVFFGVIILFNSLGLEYIDFIVGQAFFKMLLLIIFLYVVTSDLSEKIRLRVFSLASIFILMSPNFHFFMGNVLRHGFGAFFLLISLALLHKHKVLSYLSFILGFFSHKSTVVGMVIFLQKMTVKNTLTIGIFASLMLLSFFYSPWFNKIFSYINQGFYAGVSHKYVYLLAHFLMLFTLIYFRRWFVGYGLACGSHISYLYSSYRVMVFMSVVSLSLAFLTINLHYRFFGHFFFLFMISLGIRVALTKKMDYFILALLLIAILFPVVNLNLSVSNIYIGSL
jgi:hypothetical protein